MVKVQVIENVEEAREALKKIGVYSDSVDIMAPKLVFRTIKLKDVDSRAAAIIKQEMLSVGGEAAVSRGVIDFSTDRTDIILAGTLKHYRRLIAKLQRQPFGLKEIAQKINELLNYADAPIQPMECRDYTLNFTHTLIMGILNVTPDSFSDGGKFIDSERAVDRAKEMVAEGADVIDIGGESSRPGSERISEEEELSRVGSVIERVVEEVDVPLSIDTFKPNVARECLKMGVHLVNDITGLRNEEMIDVVAEYGVPVVVMHMQGMPNTMQKNPTYDDVTDDIVLFLRESIQNAKKRGVEKIIVDPGIGFGKTLGHNLIILKKLREFKSLGCPILVGPSRKSFIGNITELPVEERVEGTIASVVVSILNGANIVRVHDVKECKRAVQITDAIRCI